MTISFNRRFVYLLAGVAVMVAAGVLTSVLFPAGQRDTFSPPSPSAQAEKTPASSAGLLPSPFRADIPQPKTGWEDRLVYDAYNLYFQDPSAWQPQLRSLDDNGRGERSHPFLCDGEQVLPFPSTARSPDGQTLAFLLPAQELRQSNPNWKQELSEQIFTGKTPASGTIYLYDLDNDICRSLDKSADSLYAQNLAFSPDGRYLAYVFYGLHVYDLRTDQDFYYTVKEGSAAFPEVVLGPISWSQDSTTAYLPVIAFDPPQSETEYRTELVKLNLSQATDINRLEFPQDATDNWAFHSLRGDATAQNETFLTNLPAFHPEQYANPNNLPPTNSIFDQSHLYAVSPDEKFVALEINKNLVVRDLTNGTETALWERPPHPEEEYQQYHTERLRKIVWTAEDKLIFETGQKAAGSGIGDVWRSDKRQAPQQLVHAFGFSVRADGRKIAYNFDYFGSYYLPEEEPYPAGFEPSGHRYDGLAVYDIINNQETKLSGKDKPTGSLWPWFW